MEVILKVIEYLESNPIYVLCAIGFVINICIHLHLHTFESLFCEDYYSITEEDAEELTELIERLYQEMDDSPGC